MIRFPPAKILVAVDLSEPSLNAWRTARRLAARFKASLEALYVAEIPPPVAWEFMGAAIMTPEAKARVRSQLHEALGPGVKITVLDGTAAETILLRTGASKADMLVIGTHGRRGLARAWLGSVAESVVRHSQVPVLVVSRDEAGPIRSVLAPVNFTDYSDYGFIFAAGVAGAFGARLNALHVHDDVLRSPNPGVRVSQLLGRLPVAISAALSVETEIRRGRATPQILEAAAEHDLVVIVAHKKALLKDAVLGTTAERVLRHSLVPVLAVPAPSARFRWEKWAGEGGVRRDAAR